MKVPGPMMLLGAGRDHQRVDAIDRVLLAGAGRGDRDGIEMGGRPGRPATRRPIRVPTSGIAAASASTRLGRRAVATIHSITSPITPGTLRV